MASSSECGPCSRIDKTSPPAKWCMDCEESLCGDCVITHKTIKVTMSHHVIEIDVAASVSPEDLVYSQQCKLHPGFVNDYFCTFHDVPCCRSCISTDHRTCESVMPLEEAAKDVKNSSSYKDVTEGMNQICSALQTIAGDRNSNIQKIQQESDEAVMAISSLKASIIQRLYEKEKHLKTQLGDIREKSITKLESEKKEAEESGSLMEKYLKKLHFMENNGSCSQLFLLLHDIKTVLHEEDVHLEELTNKLESLSLVYHKEDEVTNLKDMGSVEAESKACNIKYNPLKCSGAQEMSRASTASIKSFSMDKKIPSKTDSSRITAIIVTENDDIITCDKDQLYMYSSDWNYIRSCELTDEAWDISYDCRSKQIVVALPGTVSLQYIDEFEALPNTLKVPMPCYGVALTKDNIFVAGLGEFYILDSNGKHSRTVKIGKNQLYYVHYHSNKVYTSDYTSMNNVYCIQEDGTEVFTFNSANLKGPDGIATDKNGDVYVVGRTSNNIHRLSSDGTTSEVLLSNTDGMSDPITLCFNLDYTKLFVSNNGGKEILVFTCNY